MLLNVDPCSLSHRTIVRYSGFKELSHRNLPLKNISGVYSSSLHPCSFGLTHKGPLYLTLTWKIQKASLASGRENYSCFISGDSGCDTSNTEQWSPYICALSSEILSATSPSIPIQKAFMRQVSAFSEYIRDSEIPCSNTVKSQQGYL